MNKSMLNVLAQIFVLSLIFGLCGAMLSSSPVFLILSFLTYSIGHCFTGYLGLESARRQNHERRPREMWTEVIAILWIAFARTYDILASSIGFTIGIVIGLPDERNLFAILMIFIVSCLVNMLGCCLGSILGRIISIRRHP